jgi:hypothetical protein
MVKDRIGEAAGAAGGGPVQVSVVLIGQGDPARVAWVVRALLADPAGDFEVIVIDHVPAHAHVAACFHDPRVHRFAGAGLSRADARALGNGAAQAALRVHIEMSELDGAGDGPDGPIEAALLVRPALELLQVLRAAAVATRPTELDAASAPEEVNP